DTLVRREPDRPALARLFAELEFRELLKCFLIDTKSDPYVHHRVAPAEVDALVKRLRAADEVVFDLETTSLDMRKADIVGMAFSIREGEAWYVGAEECAGESAFEFFPLELDFAAHLKKFVPILEDVALKKGGQNVKYDVQVLARHGV